VTETNTITIAICTHNRCRALAETLHALMPQARAAGADVEVIVIANDVTDATADVCGAAGVRCLHEPVRGLSHARNRAVAVARGAAILWLDDDVTVAPGLIDAYRRALAAHPEAAFFGGPIAPWLLDTPPDWADAALRVIPTVWAGLDLGAEDRPLRRGENPFGANMLIRREAFDAAFRTDLGRSGAGLVGGEESALFRSLKARGLRGRWVAAARVRHRIEPDRQTLAYVAKYFQGQAIQRVRLGDMGPEDGALGRLRACAAALQAGLRYARKRATGTPDVWLPAFAEWHVLRGLQAAHRLDVTAEGGQRRDHA
jgi:hypothetical protein